MKAGTGAMAGRFQINRILDFHVGPAPLWAVAGPVA